MFCFFLTFVRFAKFSGKVMDPITAAEEYLTYTDQHKTHPRMVRLSSGCLHCRIGGCCGCGKKLISDAQHTQEPTHLPGAMELFLFRCCGNGGRDDMPLLW